MRGRFAADLTPVLGEPMSCLNRDPADFWVEESADSLRLGFPSNYTHCWLSVSSRWFGDSAVGKWTRTTPILGGEADGQFRMWRLSPRQ